MPSSPAWAAAGRAGAGSTRLALARRQHHPVGPNSLDALCRRYGIDNSRRTHGALLDSELLAEVYIELIGGRQAALGLEIIIAGERRGDSLADHGDHRLPVRAARQGRCPPRLTARSLPPTPRWSPDSGEAAIWQRFAGPPRSDQLLNLGLRLILGDPLLEHLAEIDRIEHQRREAAVAGGVGDDLAGEGKQQSAGIR